MSRSSAVALKLGLSLAVILGVAALPAQQAQWVLLVVPLLLVLAALSHVVRPVLRGTLKALPFLVGLSSLSLFHGRGALLLGVFSKALVSVLTLQILIATTPTAELIRALRRARVPEVLCSTVALLARYSFLIGDESTRMRRARAGRTMRASRWAVWRALGSSVGLLFVRSVQRAERVQAAMRARGGA